MRRIVGAVLFAGGIVIAVHAGFGLQPSPAQATTPTPTPTPPASTALVTMSVDCDIVAPGIQSACALPPGAGSVDVAVVATNIDASSVELGVFAFNLHDPDTSRLNPPAVTTGTSFNRNPDFNDPAVTGIWQCFPVPVSDTGADGPGTAVSRIGCYTGTEAGSGVTLPPGASLTVATVHYLVPNTATAGSIPLSIDFGLFAGTVQGELGTCRPPTDYPMTCENATIAIAGPPSTTPTATPTAAPIVTASPTPPIDSFTPTATPTVPFYLALDCDLARPGIQDTCNYRLGAASSLEVGVVFVSNSEPAPPRDITGFQFKVHDPDTSRLSPPVGADTNFNGNPDFNEGGLGVNWGCSIPSIDNDTGEDGPGAAVSRLQCLNSPPLVPGQRVHAGSQTLVARVHYAIPASALVGSVILTADSVVVGDALGMEVGSCPPVDFPMPCLPATINLIQTSVHKIPEGTAANANPSIPAANLYLCLGTCAGPGEGNLLVVEHADNVRSDYDRDGIPDAVDPDITGTGLSNTELGLGAYEFQVEYDNFVIQSVNPCDIVFSPGGQGAARGNVTQLTTSAGCAPNPTPINGDCTMSLILENVIRFGCVTLGQTPGPSGSMDLARLNLIPHPDLVNDIFPGNNNGVVTIIKDNGCELSDIFGHPVLGSINGGLTPVCGDLAVTVRILEGDLNLDCQVNLADEQLIASRYGGFFGSLLYSKWYDLEPATHDLDIDIKDLQKVFGRDGSNCQNPNPAQPPLGPPAPFAN